MEKSIAVIQSNYIPWKGYFDIINQVDEFILYDDVQYTKNDWRNRNLIKTPRGSKWLTIPVITSGRFGQLINEVEVAHPTWHERHWRVITQNYKKAAFFKNYRSILQDAYLSIDEKKLSMINSRFISLVCELLEINTQIKWSTDYDLPKSSEVDPSSRLVLLCKKTKATKYITGFRAKDYLKEELFSNEGIEVSYITYDDYPEYEQLYPPFDHKVSILDLILNKGSDASKYMKSFNSEL